MERSLDNYNIPEDASSHKVAIPFVFDPSTGEFFPDKRDLYSSEPWIHRSGITQADAIYPDESLGIDCKGFKRCRFDIDVTGSNITTLRVKLLRWNSKAEMWFPSGVSVKLNDAEDFMANGGRVTLIEDEAFGAKIFLSVSEFVGDSFAMNIYYILC